MDRRQFLKGISVAGSAALLRCARMPAPGPRRQQPNFVFILADDLGWTDAGYCGSTFYQTPSIDRFARQGMVFSDAYAAAPLCSATRASLMTGKYPARLHLTGAITYPRRAAPARDPNAPRRASPSWKLAPADQVKCLPLDEVTIAEELKSAAYATAIIGKWHLGKEPWYPEHQGFDVNVAASEAPSTPSHFYPYRLRNLEGGEEGEYLADRLTIEAEKFLDQHRDGPFFLYLSHYAVHTPIQAKEQYVEKYRAKAKPGQPQSNPTYAGMVQSVDDSVGRILRKLDELGIAHRTVVIFFSDNGGLLKVPTGGAAVTSNLPLRGGKATLYEGGIRVPMVVRWPGVTRPGSVCRVPVSSVDFCPTLLEMAGVERSPGVATDGVSIVPLLEGKGGLPRDALYFHFPHYIPGPDAAESTATFMTTPCAAVRQGDWKLIKFFEGRLELYNLRDDVGETRNLAAEMPERASQLAAKLDQWLKDTGAWLPTPNPSYDPALARTGWSPSKDCTLSVEGGILRVIGSRRTACTGGDPFLSARLNAPGGRIVATLRMRLATRGRGQLFWTTDLAPRWHRDGSVSFDLEHDGKWHDYSVAFSAPGRLTGVRLDPGTAPGEVEIEWIRLHRGDALVREWCWRIRAESVE